MKILTSNQVSDIGTDLSMLLMIALDPDTPEMYKKVMMKAIPRIAYRVGGTKLITKIAHFTVAHMKE